MQWLECNYQLLNCCNYKKKLSTPQRSWEYNWTWNELTSKSLIIMISSLQRLWGLPGSEDNDEITSASRQTHSLWTTWTTTEMLIDWNSSEELTFISSHWFCSPNSYSSRGVFSFCTDLEISCEVPQKVLKKLMATGSYSTRSCINVSMIYEIILKQNRSFWFSQFDA